MGMKAGFLLFLFFSSVVCIAQGPTAINGRIVDRKTGEPLEAAVVTDSNTGRHTLTDDGGRFSLRGVVCRRSRRFPALVIRLKSEGLLRWMPFR